MTKLPGKWMAKLRRWTAGMWLLACLAVVTLTGCTGSAAPSAGAPAALENDVKFGGSLVIQSSGLVQFDPIYIADDNSFQVVSNVFSLLFRYQGADAIPDLATAWEYLDDQTLLFHLRKGVMWHDDNEVFAKGASREVVASDVVYSIRRAVNSQDASTPADLLDSFQAVEALDDYTVKVTLKTPNALLFVLGRGLSMLAIVPEEAVVQLGDRFGLNPIGSGPYKFVAYRPDDALILARNDLYWQRPYLDQVVFQIMPDQDAAVIALETGEIDILARVPHTELDRLSHDDRFVLYPGTCPIMTQLLFNMDNALFSQQQFRQAIAYALDGDAINRNVYGAMHIPGCGTAGPGVPGYDPDLCDYFRYDPEAAKALLVELGWTDGDGDGLLDKNGQPLALAMEIWNMSPMPQFGAAIATQLREIGILVDLEMVEFGTWIADWNAGVDKAMVMSGWCGDGGMNGLWGENGMARAMGYNDPQVFALLNRANAILDPAERDEILRAAASEIYGQYWAVPMGFYTYHRASRAWVHDYQGTLPYQNLCTDRNNVWLAKKRR